VLRGRCVHAVESARMPRLRRPTHRRRHVRAEPVFDDDHHEPMIGAIV
jgi:hypothetical protein